MSLGHLTAFIQLDKARLSGGFSDGGRPFNNVVVKFTGRLSDLDYGEFRGPLPNTVKSSADIEIDFTDAQERDRDTEEYGTGDLEEEDTIKPYIGTIHLTTTENELHAQVFITLPIIMFHQLIALGEKEILLDTTYDIVTNPSEREKTDHIIAYVKRAYFERRYSWGKE